MPFRPNWANPYVWTFNDIIAEYAAAQVDQVLHLFVVRRPDKKCGRKDGRTDQQTDGQTDSQTDRQKDRQTDRRRGQKQYFSRGKT